MKTTQLGPLELANLYHWASKIKRLKWNKPNKLGPFEGANLNHWKSKIKRLKWNKTYSVGSLRRRAKLE
jgi:hypothetical protein